MEKARVEEYKRRTAQQELGYLQLALSHVTERLQSLNPGINVTLENYRTLLAEKQALTQGVIDAILRVNGTDFNTQDHSLYVVNNVVLRLGGIRGSRVRLST